ncbi:MAG: hypothetical protein COV50_01370 [Flavobacteriales bacterium CG11_big_fil_rev_8_21_14_0_20_35_7]|nr:MAG: hypothetical protein COV50_01370 [Flavobacteriales bacterium CG11_big_fil_rev_8_21_14_0_20_35_7]
MAAIALLALVSKMLTRYGHAKQFCAINSCYLSEQSDKSNVLCERSDRQKAHLTVASGKKQKTGGGLTFAKNWILFCGDFYSLSFL